MAGILYKLFIGISVYFYNHYYRNRTATETFNDIADIAEAATPDLIDHLTTNFDN